ncbi:MAG: hypothetical protein GX552_11595 [Chloroflexi bacterium]|jgi:rubrerythrin|nr:hypothetical protein [Chloroflexota bacterium]
MSAQRITAAVVIGFTERLESDSARFYEGLAERFPEQRRVFEGYVKEAKSNSTNILRTYQETVTDALETNYSFEGMALPDYEPLVALAPDATLSQAAAQAVQLEELAVAFYQDVAERSKSLLATIPGAFKRVARKRGARVATLQKMA